MPRSLFIDGVWQPGKNKESHPIHRPFDGCLIDHVPLATREEIESAIISSQKAFEKVRSIPSHERSNLLHRVSSLIDKRRSDFSKTISDEAGKPITLAQSEVTRAIQTFTSAAEEARNDQIKGLSIDAFATGKSHFGISRRFPIGLIYGITPFNFPLNLVAHKVAPCIATNNVMFLKPALKTPLTAFLLGEVLEEAGLPKGQINILTCTHEVADYLIEDDRIKKISFTGSPLIGWKLKSRCGTKKITLELGGNAAVIVHSDADFSQAIPAIATGAFSNAGQSCISVQRIFVHRPLLEKFKEEFLDYITTKIQRGDPSDPKTLVGPMIDSSALTKTIAWIEEALSQGATLLCGGKPEGTILPPTLLLNVPHHCKIYSEEAFAPVAILEPYEDFDAAINEVNQSAYGIHAGIYTQDIQRIWSSFEKLEVGGVLINQVPTFRTENMPYGGSKSSGFGREGVRYAMDEMTELKSLVINVGK